MQTSDDPAAIPGGDLDGHALTDAKPKKAATGQGLAGVAQFAAVVEQDGAAQGRLVETADGGLHGRNLSDVAGRLLLQTPPGPGAHAECECAPETWGVVDVTAKPRHSFAGELDVP